MSWPILYGTLKIGRGVDLSGSRKLRVSDSTPRFNYHGFDGTLIESRWEARFSPHVQIGPGNPPASCTMDTGPFSGLKRPERGGNHPPSHSAEVEERVELYFTTLPLGLRGLYYFECLTTPSRSKSLFPFTGG